MLEVRPLADGEQSTVVAVVSRAFWPDPLFGFFARSALQEHRMMPWFVRATIDDTLRHGKVDVAVRDGRIVGSASWIGPESITMGFGRQARIALGCAPGLVAARNRITGLRLLDRAQRLHPHEPHDYLALIGVDPSAQRGGIGRALLAPRLASADERTMPVYLETQKPDNVPYYAALGFAVLGEVRVAGSPAVFRMWREPRA